MTKQLQDTYFSFTLTSISVMLIVNTVFFKQIYMYIFVEHIYIYISHLHAETSLREPGREYVDLIWDAVREQTLIQLIQKVILSPLKAVLPARSRVCHERNHN